MADLIPTKREIIESQLLTALDDKSRVAILLSEDELRLVIDAFDAMNEQRHPEEKAVEFRDDLWKLMEAAFSPTEGSTDAQQDSQG